MCYLRNFPAINEYLPSKDQFYSKYEENSQQSNTCLEKNQNEFIFNNKNLKQTIENSLNSTIFLNLLMLAQKNSQTLSRLENKMEQNTTLFDQISQNQQLSSINNFSNTISQSKDSLLSLSSFQINNNDFKSQQIITQKLFGQNRQYKYKLVLNSQLSELLFKQRNFSFNIKLVDRNNKTVKNSNIIHLCLGVCDIQGNWITQTKSKQNLLKGKTQCELYHGVAQYEKIYSRDVSRNYPEGKLNLVIYPKQSVIKYCQSANFLEELVDTKDIEPLVIKDLTIRAKKKE